MRTRKSAQRGATLIEFVMVAFMLMIVILAGIEFDRMVLVYTALANSARAGVRYAIVHGSHRNNVTGDPPSGSANQDAVIAKVRQYASAGTINTSVSVLSVVVQYPDATDNKPGSHVIVKVSYPYDPFIALPLHVNITSATQGIIVY